MGHVAPPEWNFQLSFTSSMYSCLFWTNKLQKYVCFSCISNVLHPSGEEELKIADAPML